MDRLEKGTWHSRVEEILCRDFGNLYGRLTEITQQMLLQDAHAYVINRRDLDSSIRDGDKHACRRVCGFVYWTIIQVLGV